MHYHRKSTQSVLALLCAVLLAFMGAISGVYVTASDMSSKAVSESSSTAPVMLAMPSATNITATHTASATKTITETYTHTVKPNIPSGSVVLEDNFNITALNILPSIGNLSIKRGTQYQIEVGAQLVDHAIYEVKDGVLWYFDDYAGKNIDVQEIDGDYDITITIPGKEITFEELIVANGLGTVHIENINAVVANISNKVGESRVSGIRAGALDICVDFGAATISNCTLSGTLSYQGQVGGLTLDTIQAQSLKLNVQTGGVEMTNCTVDGSVICEGQTGGYTIEGLQAASLTFKNQLGGLTVQKSTISSGMNISLASGGVDISGDIKGDIFIEKGMGGFDLTLTDSRRSDYHIIFGDANDNKMSSLVLSGIRIDGERYPNGYRDTHSDAPYMLTIASSNDLGTDVSVRFGKK